MHTVLTVTQHTVLLRLQSFLCRRAEVDQYEATADEEQQRWLVRALDHAIVGYYRLACDSGLEEDAAELLRRYRCRGSAAPICAELSLAA